MYDVYDVILGALLHDIGKLHMKGGPDGESVAGLTICKEHPLLSAAFIEKHRKVIKNAGFNVDAVKEIAQRHHEGNFPESCLVACASKDYRDACKKVSEADNCSSSERINGMGLIGGNPFDSGKEYRKQVSASVFSAVSKDGKLYTYKVGTYKDSIAELSDTHRINSYDTNREFIAKFDSAFSSLECIDKISFINEVDRLLREYAWCFPSDVKYIYKDVSLYDHLKTTAAMAQIFYAKAFKDLRNTNIAIVQLQVEETHQVHRKTDGLIGIDDVIRDSDKLSSMFQSLLSDIQSIGTGITNCNIIMQTNFSARLIISAADLDKVVDLILKHSTNMAIQSNLSSYIKFAYGKDAIAEDTGDKLDWKFTRTNEIIQNVAASLSGNKIIGGIRVFGLSDILVKDNKWADLDISINQESAGGKEDKVDNNKYALIKLSISNIDKLVSSMLRINKHRIISWAKNTNKDIEDELLDYSSVSRIAAIYRVINGLLTVNNWLNVKIIQQTETEISFIMTFSDFINTFSKYIDKLNRGSANTFNIASSIMTFSHREDIETLYRKLDANHAEVVKQTVDTDASVFEYNGKKITLDELKKITEICNWILASADKAKAPLYRTMEFISQYKQYIDNNITPMCIPRFSYTKNRIFNRNTIDEQLDSFISSNFSAIRQSGKPSNLFLVLDTIIHDTL